MQRPTTTPHFLLLLVIVSLLPFSTRTVAATQASTPIDPQVLNAMTLHGTATFWVLLQSAPPAFVPQAPLTWAERGRVVVDRLQATAKRTQAGLRDELHRAHVPFQSFWLANTIRVTADATLLRRIAARPEVKRIVGDSVALIPKPLPSQVTATSGNVEWNIERIAAPRVWQEMGATGQGIVVASIDTGVEYTHPALVRQYRGTLGDGTFDHNYNWYDPSHSCGTPSLAPCDNHGHGTHTLGIIIGDDGATKQIGVAPNARWIAVKGCETDACSTESLLAAGEWLLAPTDLNGQNPRPDLRPNIVNNSWLYAGNNPFYQAIVQGWVQAGIFPVFAAGNGGSACATLASPADYAESYAVGAFDNNNQIAWFSSRGSATFGDSIADAGPKPNIAAPGVDIRSAWPGHTYAIHSGTSMAAPHMAGAVALLWSAAPSLIGNIEATRALFNETAIDTTDLSCGGTPEYNNVWGAGRLDVYNTMLYAPIAAAPAT